MDMKLLKGKIYGLLAGVLIGYGALVKPALMMFPLLWVLFLIMEREVSRNSVNALILGLIGVLCVVLPWSVRNSIALHAFVPISINGGDVFYRANNPGASGGYSSAGERDLNQYLHDEVLWNHKGFEWGKEWIREHPFSFLKLALKKQAILLGRDDTGVYWTMHRGHNVTGPAYYLMRLISNVWWILIWTLAIAAVLRHRRYFSGTATGGLMLWTTLFFVVVHSVLESQPRYHMPTIAFFAILAA